MHVADRQAGASNPHPHPIPHLTYSHRQSQQQCFSTSKSSVTDGPTDSFLQRCVSATLKKMMEDTLAGKHSLHCHTYGNVIECNDRQTMAVELEKASFLNLILALKETPVNICLFISFFFIESSISLTHNLKNLLPKKKKLLR